MRLDDLLEGIADIEALTGAGEVTSLACDSRQVLPGGVFVAIRGGQERDRHQFIDDAIARGAAAVVVEDAPALPTPGSVAVVRVANCRVALSALSARLYGYPAREMRCVGITGTNGKTTTALLTRRILEAAGQSCGYVGTLGAAVVGEDLEPLSNTTPEAPELQALLRRMASAGRKAVVLEVSSHALALDRTRDISLVAAVFTNLTRDHLDFHVSEAAYLEAKARIFEQLSETQEACAVVNLDDPVSSVLLERLGRARTLTFGAHADADVRLLEANFVASGTVMSLSTTVGRFELRSRLTGSFNCSNVMAAVACALGLGVEREAICHGVEQLQAVPGRLEAIDEGQEFRVLVDYAHTPAGLETVLKTAREFTEHRLICLFGCGGDRDVGKRPLMGKVAREQADLVVLTSDNPRTESPDRIIADISAAASPAVVCTDRREAIYKAVEMARGGDTLVIAGKGDEAQQVFADRVVEFDDRLVAREALRWRRSRRGSPDCTRV